MSMPTPLPSASVDPAPRTRSLWLELVAAFVIAPGVLALGPRWLVTVGIITSGGVSLAVLLRDSTFDRRSLWDAAAARAGMGTVLRRTVVVWAVLFLVTMVKERGHLFELPRTQPWLWLMVMILYPVLSAYAQEVMFRTLFFHRYGVLFRRAGSRVIASGTLFGWAHIVVHNGTAMVLATAGGLLFASTYAKRRSTLLVATEHALYGDFIFTIGLSSLFYNARRWVAILSR